MITASVSGLQRVQRGASHDVACLAQHGGVQRAQLPEHHPQAVDVRLLCALLAHQLLCNTALTQLVNTRLSQPLIHRTDTAVDTPDYTVLVTGQGTETLLIH